MKIGCCTTIDQYDALVQAGYDAITLSGRDIFSMSEEAFQRAVTKIKDGPLILSSVNSFCPPQVKLNGEDHDLSAVRDYTEALCRRAKQLGIRYLGVGSPNSRKVQEGFCPDKALRQFEQSVALICQIAAKYDMEVLLEALATIECNCVTTTAEALAMVERLKIDDLHLVYDIYHAYMMGEGPEEISKAIHEIRSVHISRPEDGDRYYLNEECMELFRPYLDTLAKEGFSGELSLEAFSGPLPDGFVESIALLKKYRTGR